MPLHHTVMAGIYPIASVALPKPGPFEDVDAVVEGLLRQIEEHPRARLITVFDLLEHAWETASAIPAQMRGVKQVIVCFGGAIPNSQAIALRPHTISVVENTDGFEVNYMASGTPDFDNAMGGWLTALAEELP